MISIIVPVFNEVQTISFIIDALHEKTPGNCELIFVDDGSTDGSREFLMELQKRTGPQRKTFLFHDRNRGRGAAIRSGLAVATGTVICPQDADLEYDPAEISELAQPITAGTADVVYGSRFMDAGSHGMSIMQNLGNRILTGMCNKLSGTSLTDLMTCYKLYRTSIVRELTLVSDGFEFEAEITAKLLRSGYDIIEKPVRYARRSSREGKKMTWKSAWPIARRLVQCRNV